jgi:hypothetical protein
LNTMLTHQLMNVTRHHLKILYDVSIYDLMYVLNKLE